jgi:hypothetical protein
VRSSWPRRSFRYVKACADNVAGQHVVIRPLPRGCGWTACANRIGSGRSKITHSGGVNSFHTSCFQFHDTFRGRSRMATATGSVNRKSLGTTKNASLSTQADVVPEHRC